MSAPRHPRRRLVIFGGVVAVATVVGAIIGAPSDMSLRDAVDSLGVSAPLVFVVVYAALTVGLIPGAALSIAAGAAFGLLVGTLVTVAGATLGATAAFALGRRLSRESVRAIAGDRTRRVDEQLAEQGLLSVIVLRLVPLVPFNALNYAAGATAVRPRDYVLGTLVGIIPGSVVFTAAGSSAADPGSPLFLGSLAALALLTAGGAYWARRLRS